ncbi:DUF6807 domain-containing protein [Actinoplanes sp. RD1]|uniref:DUF6807 domain-containing protein n=1 Tax=Actinoplanes sp. RD1 TaxID=3064538 RepID=UPI00274227A8|nr:PmoA family protein [Actinoplanes sp. RD1]
MSTELFDLDGAPLATYVIEPQLDIRLGPRPYLHPVRTLSGTTVTDALCQDHPWHLGASLALQDVNGVNFWGGRTYVRDQGYTWLDDHGRIVPSDARADPSLGAGRQLSVPSLATGQQLSVPSAGAGRQLFSWQDQHGTTLLTERRELTAGLAPGGWQLTFRYALSAPAEHPVTLGSPATNGRPGGAGYGGFFWRAAPAPGETLTFTQSRMGEHAVNGSAEPWLALRAGEAYTLVFQGLRNNDRWFVRTADYPGVCAALAFDRPLTLPAGATLDREIKVLISDDATLEPDDIAKLLA